MTTPMLTIQISVLLTTDSLELTYDHERVTLDAYKTARLTLELHEAVQFEAQDFVANGHTYRVHASYTNRELRPYPWERLAQASRSPIFADPIDFDLTITAIPATKSVPTQSTTSTVVIIKKGKPEPLQLTNTRTDTTERQPEPLQLTNTAPDVPPANDTSVDDDGGVA